MEIPIYILKIAFYFIIVLIMYFMTLKNVNKKKRISLICIIIISLLFGYYSIICGQYPYASDRLNFAIRFVNDAFAETVKIESLGLYWIHNILHFFTYDPKILFFTCSFIYIFLTLIAYKMYDDAEPNTLLILGLSSYCTFGFYMLKQSIAVAFVAIAFAAITRNKKILCILSIMVAICFHESAWVIIPIFFAMHCSKNKLLRNLEYLFLLFCVIFFKDINHIFINIATKIIPGMSEQISYYLDESGSINTTSNFLTILKGVPFYFVTIFGFVKRNELKNKIKNYDKYMFCCCFVSVATIISCFMYWMFRFALYCYLPVFVFSSLIIRELDKKEDKKIFKFGFIFTSFILTLRLWMQYYFIYGGI